MSSRLRGPRLYEFAAAEDVILVEGVVPSSLPDHDACVYLLLSATPRADPQSRAPQGRGPDVHSQNQHCAVICRAGLRSLVAIVSPPPRRRHLHHQCRRSSH